MTVGAARAPLAVLAPVHPLVSGAAQFNTAMLAAFGELVPVQAISWRRLYPPLLHRRGTHDLASRPTRMPHAEVMLDWADPRTWRQALRAVAAAGARALILPWVHPVMTPPYRYLLRHAPPETTRIVICHNVKPHEPVPLGSLLTRAALRHADVFVIHASHQRAELRGLGFRRQSIVDAFHPRFAASDLSVLPTPGQVDSERARQGNPGLSLLAFGAIRPYKGIDLALEAMARVPAQLRARLTVAGVFWDGGRELRARAAALGIEDRVELRDGFISNEDAALLFAVADASLLPYRSATQSGVVQLSFAYGVPVIATAVGGLVEAVASGENGILCPPNDPGELARAIEQLAIDRASLAEGVRRTGHEASFLHYCELLLAALDLLPTRAQRHWRPARTMPPTAMGEVLW